MSASTADPAIAGVFRRPFAEQLEFWRGKLANLVPTARWDDLWKSAHDRAFMVAGAAKADLLADLAAAVDKAVADGETLDAFRRRFDEIVRRHGWRGWTGEESEAGRAWRTRIIYQTNLATSYAAGRLAQLKDAGFRLWIYRHSGAEHPRLQHLAWDGLTLPADHPFWQTHFPPSGWGCRCRVVGANGPEGAKLLGGKPGYTEPPAGWDAIDPKTGEPPGIDRGWGYMPGNTADLVRQIERKTASMPAPLAQALRDDIETQQAVGWVVAQGMREGDIEYAVAIRDGQTVLRKRGGASHVSFSDAELASMRGATLVHNHPFSSSLSRADLYLTANFALGEIVAAGHDGSQYRARVVSVTDLLRYYDVADRHAYQRINAMIRAGLVSTAEAERWHHHAVNEGLARAGIIEYRASALPAEPAWVNTVAAVIEENIARLRQITGG